MLPASHTRRPRKLWLFDLDNTLHNASRSAFTQLNTAMTDYTVAALGLEREHADVLRHQYWRRYGATLLGLVRHHGVDAAHFLHHTHELPGLEQRLQFNRADIAAVARLPGRRYVFSNSPMAYAQRVLGELGLLRHFDGVISIEDMRMFGQWRPKPDTRSLRAVAQRLRVPPSHCVLVEDALENLKAARRLGMHTIWLQRWLLESRRVSRALAHGGGPKGGHQALRRPAYVDQRVHGARAIRR